MIVRFLKYVEIKTKITSAFAFLMTMAYLFLMKQPVKLKATIIFFISMIAFDLTTTAINNYIDTRTNMQELQFNRKTALAIIFLLLGISAAAGIYLVYLTDMVVLLIGALCFLCGILYTFGPVPISRQPLGEILSGIFYGFFIPFLLLYINMPKGTYLSLYFDPGTIQIELRIIPFITVFLLSVAPVFATANIMLANNICDLEKDIRVKRYTLPYYLGGKSLHLFAGLYYSIYGAAIAMVTMKILPPVSLLLLLTIMPVQKNISNFFNEQDKDTTFIASIKNYIIIMGANTLLIFISGLLNL